jgi:hypothetical protein
MNKTQLRLKQKYTKNINYVLNQAVSTDFIEGERWYRDARLFAFEVSKDYGVSFRKVSAILAALSPRNRWERNKEDCITLIKECQGLIPYGKYATYGTMVSKAKKIYNSPIDSVQVMLKLLNGQKISAFFLNIYDIQSECVTVDSWIQLISLGKYLSVDERPPLKKTEYKLISESIREIAALNKVTPPVMQAILWISFKRMTQSKDFN